MPYLVSGKAEAQDEEHIGKEDDLTVSDWFDE